MLSKTKLSINPITSLRNLKTHRSKDKQLVSKHVKDFIYEIMEHLLGFFTREDRAICFNDMAKRFNIKIDVENDKSKPMHIEMVKNNFQSIISTLRVYEQK